jgi:hypothetical protein
MALSLKKMCMQALVENIKELPPVLLQELLGETKKNMKKDAEKKIWDNLKDTLPYIIDDLVSEKIEEIQGIGSLYTKKYEEIDKNIIDIARRSADSVGRKLEPILFERSLNFNMTHRRYNRSNVSGEDEEEDSEYDGSDHYYSFET